MPSASLRPGPEPRRPGEATKTAWPSRGRPTRHFRLFLCRALVVDPRCCFSAPLPHRLLRPEDGHERRRHLLRHEPRVAAVEQGGGERWAPLFLPSTTGGRRKRRLLSSCMAPPNDQGKMNLPLSLCVRPCFYLHISEFNQPIFGHERWWKKINRTHSSHLCKHNEYG